MAKFNIKNHITDRKVFLLGWPHTDKVVTNKSWKKRHQRERNLGHVLLGKKKSQDTRSFTAVLK